MNLYDSPSNRDMADTIARSMVEKGYWPACTEQDIWQLYYCEQDGYQKMLIEYFNALAALKERNHCYSLEDITDPEDNMIVFIRKPRTRVQYQYRAGEWSNIGDIPDSSFY